MRMPPSADSTSRPSTASRGVGRSFRSTAPRVTTFAPVARDNSASIKPRCADQSTSHGPTSATVSNATTLAAATATYTPGTLSSSTDQYEGITLDTNGTQHFYVSQEISPAKIVQLDGAGSAQGEEYQSTGVSFSSSNKGFEGIAWVRRNSDDYLLALCEAGNCGGTTGTSLPGMIKVLRQTGSSWTVDATISLCGNTSCTTGIFSDYSDIALFPLADGSYKVAITSQESRQLWIGNLSATSWAFTSSGTRYDYPSLSYCNVEGVTFLTASRLALTSDQYTDNESRCYDEDESMHIVDIP